MLYCEIGGPTKSEDQIVCSFYLWASTATKEIVNINTDCMNIEAFMENRKLLGIARNL